MNTLQPGMVFAGRYRLVRQIAVGGMGEVWAGRDDALARDVALKILRGEFAGNPDFLQRLRAEARNTAGLSHPNIAQLFDYGEQDGLGFLVMELVHGEPMSDLLDRQPVLPLAQLFEILSQTARGLHAAHVAGVVHRDVKPGNILLERGGSVKITDFGVSHAIDQEPMTATGMVMGTAQYLSPEQAVGRPATPSSDIYALGVIAFEATVGHRPFTGRTPVEIAVAHVNEPVPRLPASVPAPFATLIARMLAKEPEERPRSALALSRSLDNLAAELKAGRLVAAPATRNPTRTSVVPTNSPTTRAWSSNGSGQQPRTPAAVRVHNPAAHTDTPPLGQPTRARITWRQVALAVLILVVIVASIVGLLTTNDAPQGLATLAGMAFLTPHRLAIFSTTTDGSQWEATRKVTAPLFSATRTHPGAPSAGASHPISKDGT